MVDFLGATTRTRLRRADEYIEILLQAPPRDWAQVYDALRGISPDGAREAPDGAEAGDGPFATTALTFPTGEPDCFFDVDVNEGRGRLPYRGQDAAKRELLLEIQSLYRQSPDERLKLLLVGPAGSGKTTLARIVAKLLRNRRRDVGMPDGTYVELLPAQVPTKARLDAFMQWVVQDSYRTVFIDEVHTLAEIEPWFTVLHDTGTAYYGMADGSRVEIPPTISWLTATTDPGMLDARAEGALRRRLQPEIVLEAPGEDVLAQIVMDAGASDGMPVEPLAAQDIARRGLFPWQARSIYEKARKVAALREAATVTVDDAYEAFDILGLDELGLQRQDRAVIRALFQVPHRRAGKDGQIVYAMAEEPLCSAAGIDRGTYKKRVQPKMLRLGLLNTSWKQSLTEKAIRVYGHLRPAG